MAGCFMKVDCRAAGVSMEAGLVIIAIIQVRVGGSHVSLMDRETWKIQLNFGVEDLLMECMWLVRES